MDLKPPARRASTRGGAGAAKSSHVIDLRQGAGAAKPASKRPVPVPVPKAAAAPPAPVKPAPPKPTAVKVTPPPAAINPPADEDSLELDELEAMAATAPARPSNLPAPVEPLPAGRRFWPAFWRFLVLLLVLAGLISGGLYIYVNYYRA